MRLMTGFHRAGCCCGNETPDTVFYNTYPTPWPIHRIPSNRPRTGKGDIVTAGSDCSGLCGATVPKYLKLVISGVALIPPCTLRNAWDRVRWEIGATHPASVNTTIFLKWSGGATECGWSYTEVASPILDYFDAADTTCDTLAGTYNHSTVNASVRIFPAGSGGYANPWMRIRGNWGRSEGIAVTPWFGSVLTPLEAPCFPQTLTNQIQTAPIWQDPTDSDIKVGASSGSITVSAY